MSSKVSQKAVSCSRTEPNWLLTSSFLLLGGLTLIYNLFCTRVNYLTDSLGDLRDQIRRVGGDELINRCKPVWGLDSEGEIMGAWRNLGVPNMWYMMGQFYPFSLYFQTIFF